jgi:hypothetical protein
MVPISLRRKFSSPGARVATRNVPERWEVQASSNFLIEGEIAGDPLGRGILAVDVIIAVASDSVTGCHARRKVVDAADRAGRTPVWARPKAV